MVAIIVAMGENNVIGDKNKLLWTLKDDLKRFKELTLNNIVVMGKNTYYSLPSSKPLKNRINIVISKSEKISGVEMVSSIDDAVFTYKKYKKDVYIIGGESIYKQFISIVDKIYLTVVDTTLDGDTYFPKLNNNEWDIETINTHKKNKNNEYSYINYIYHKKLQ